MELYIVLVPITGTYAIEIEAQSAIHAKAIISQLIARDEKALDGMEMSEYEIQWDSISAVHVENDETAGGSGFDTDREAMLATRLQLAMLQADNAIQTGNETINTIVIPICEAILADHENLKVMARTMIDGIKRRRNQ